MRRSLDAEINLVPFIDLLSMCICFLLMTAVWMQIAAMQVRQSRGTEAQTLKAKDQEMDLRFTGPFSLTYKLKKNGKATKTISILGLSVEELVSKFDKELSGSQNTAIANALITPKDGVPYGTLVAVMDQLRRHNIVNLGVIPVSTTRGVN